MGGSWWGGRSPQALACDRRTAFSLPSLCWSDCRGYKSGHLLLPGWCDRKAMAVSDSCEAVGNWGCQAMRIGCLLARRWGSLVIGRWCWREDRTEEGDFDHRIRGAGGCLGLDAGVAVEGCSNFGDELLESCILIDFFHCYGGCSCFPSDMFHSSEHVQHLRYLFYLLSHYVRSDL